MRDTGRDGRGGGGEEEQEEEEEEGGGGKRVRVQRGDWFLCRRARGGRASRVNRFCGGGMRAGREEEGAWVLDTRRSHGCVCATTFYCGPTKPYIKAGSAESVAEVLL